MAATTTQQNAAQNYNEILQHVLFILRLLEIKSAREGKMTDRFVSCLDIRDTRSHKNIFDSLLSFFT